MLRHRSQSAITFLRMLQLWINDLFCRFLWTTAQRRMNRQGEPGNEKAGVEILLLNSHRILRFHECGGSVSLLWVGSLLPHRSLAIETVYLSIARLF